MTHPWEAPPAGIPAAIAATVAGGVPEVTTDRLLLRAPRVDDFGAYAAILMSGRGRHMGGPFDREGAWADFTQAVAGWMLRGTGVWTIARRSDGGTVGFAFLWQEFGDPEPEIGWALTEAAEGNGYATEAARAVLALARDWLGPGRTVSYIDAANAASIRVAERLGARRDPAAEAALGDPEMTVWRHPGEVT